MSLTKKLLSYLFPLTKRIKSEHNGDLEVTLSNGRKVLDSANANYSYGSLQRVLKFALAEVYSPAIERILVLGLGGGSVVATLTEDFGFAGEITAVDIDPVIIQIAREEFGIVETKNLHIVCADARFFLEQATDTHDLIIVDLFIDTAIPEQFLAVDFWQCLRQKVRQPGHVIFNAFAATTAIQSIKAELTKLGFVVREHLRVEATNAVLIASLR